VGIFAPLGIKFEIARLLSMLFNILGAGASLAKGAELGKTTKILRVNHIQGSIQYSVVVCLKCSESCGYN